MVAAVALGLEMVAVRGGSFEMGNSFGDGDSNEKLRTVRVSDFKIGKYEVTQGLWQDVMGSNPSHYIGPKLPVENVSWFDVQKFLAKLNAKTGKKYRLPTEAEWEYAARSGGKKEKYAGTSDGDLGAYAWYVNNSGEKTHPVGQKKPNGQGLHDMSGNGLEWCSDWYGDYSSGTAVNAAGPSNGKDRVVRGGCWGDGDWSARVANRRYSRDPGQRDHLAGFRLALGQ